MKNHDVFSFGVVSSSTLYTIQGDFPTPEGYAEIDNVQHVTGGEAANSSIVLSRLGVSVKLDGNWLGADDGGKRTKALLADYQIDTSRLPLKKDYEGVQEVVFAAKETRTIFGSYGRLLENAHWNTPHEEDVTQAKVICLDPFFDEASRRVADIAFQAGIPVVTVDCRHDDPLLPKTSAVVIAESFIRENYVDHDLPGLFRKYQGRTEGIVIFTFGDRAIWYARPGESVKKVQPFSIEPVDTSGGGDSFRAGIVYGLLMDWDDKQTIEFAAAIAALVCTRFPGVLNAPGVDEALDFMRSRQMSASN
jgi:sugar/nucleoside kinase (ribokinase family)